LSCFEKEPQGTASNSAAKFVKCSVSGAALCSSLFQDFGIPMKSPLDDKDGEAPSFSTKYGGRFLLCGTFQIPQHRFRKMVNTLEFTFLAKVI
jgi:hypothetical protein